MPLCRFWAGPHGAKSRMSESHRISHPLLEKTLRALLCISTACTPGVQPGLLVIAGCDCHLPLWFFCLCASHASSKLNLLTRCADGLSAGDQPAFGGLSPRSPGQSGRPDAPVSLQYGIRQRLRSACARRGAHSLRSLQRAPRPKGAFRAGRSCCPMHLASLTIKCISRSPSRLLAQSRFVMGDDPEGDAVITSARSCSPCK